MKIIRVCAIILASLFVSPIGFSQTTWTGGGTDDLWFNNDNWDMTAPNGVTVDVIVGAPSPTIINGNVNINSLMVTADGIIFLNSGLNLDFGGTATTTLTNAGIINTAANTDLQFQQMVVNSGTINLGDDLEIDGGATVMGGGVINLTTSLVNVNGTGTLINVDNTFQGEGNFGSNVIGINNQAGGMIDANINGATLNVDPSAALGMTNSGTMQASNGGILSLSGFGSGAFDNTGGTIQALDGSQVVLISSVVISNGTISSSGSGFVNVLSGNSAFLNNVTNTGTISTENNSTLGISGTINNSGTISITSTGNNTFLNLNSGDTSLIGGGSVVLSSPTGLTTAIINGGGTLSIVDQTIEGNGSIGGNVIGIDVQVAGLIDANVNGEVLNIDPSAALGLTNAGMMQASNGGILSLSGFGNGAFDNTGGTIQALDGSEVRLVSSAVITGGTLSTTGTGTFTLPASGSASIVDLTTTGNLVTGNSSNLGISGTINNTGSISVNSTGNNTSVTLFNGDVTIDGGGTITLNSTPGNTEARIIGTGMLFVADQTIEGSGSIGANVIGIVNQANGLIDANVAGEMLNVDPSSALGLQNMGAMQASNGGILRIDGFGSGSFNNTGGLIQALDNSVVQLVTTAAISGGTLSTDGSGQFTVVGGNSVFLTDLATTGTIATENSSSLGLGGTINNSGMISINSGGNSTNIVLQGGATITGGGTIVLNSTAGQVNARILGTGTLVNSNQTIEGSGSIGLNVIGINNHLGGTINANVNGETIFIDPSALSIANTGTLQASNGGTLAFADLGTWTNDGTLNAGAGSEIVFQGNDPVLNSTTSTLMGSGIISAQNFEISGVVAPGASAGILTLEERTTVANSGVLLMDDAILQIEIGGTTLGSEYDQLNIEGTLGIMNSELQVSLINGYVPGQSDIFTIVNVNTIGAEDTFFGTFSNGSLVSFPGGTFDITYTSNSVILSNFQRVIPEPGTFSVVALLGLLAVGRRRRRIQI